MVPLLNVLRIHFPKFLLLVPLTVHQFYRLNYQVPHLKDALLLPNVQLDHLLNYTRLIRKVMDWIRLIHVHQYHLVTIDTIQLLTTVQVAAHEESINMKILIKDRPIKGHQITLTWNLVAERYTNYL